MTKAKVLVDDILIFLEGRYFAQIKVFEVPKSSKFPEGVKVRCALVLKTYPEAIAYFIRESKRILSNEKK